jgi:hypothetical protein
MIESMKIRMKFIISVLIMIAVVFPLVYYSGEYRCPVENCMLVFTGKSQSDEMGHLYWVYECSCCNRYYSIKR